MQVAGVCTLRVLDPPATCERKVVACYEIRAAMIDPFIIYLQNYKIPNPSY